MSSHSAESLNCFSLLSDKIPSWISRVSELAVHTAAKQEEFKSDYIKYSVKEKRPRRRKGSSLHTHRPEDEESGCKTRVPSDPHDPCLEPLTRMKILKQPGGDVNNNINRKRRTGEDASGPSDQETERAIRPRHQFLIHYDCHSQAVLEKLVREIGGARNQIRKSRMSYMMKSGFGRKSVQPGFSSDDGMKPIFRSTRSFNKSAGKESPFDVADIHLESAQALCETAAHQFLRNGDCSFELSRTKEKLDLALDVAKVEVERSSEAVKIEEAEAEAEAMAKEEENQREAELLPAEQKIEKDGKGADGPPTAIEVDDASDNSSISIDITAFRSSRLRR
ncbi:hypothetical protein D8B26_002416 [Coccidioides posadasii str. Silveira]|uniref:Uncharacterized protein n=2 Tax=Coccidioides posadasii TaxID=199306 RepID=E9DHJ6_COCPS|nr:conserved hypothetical protein [Coccidioides posadasii str. Silveira]KMM65845.1 hypothetical protein CPAG_02188 [Coccidioides posadasii RMSCC 3488]QVM07725.1 hypothetical protein D8B26_002416 [Coccidioides posadasii str. Silveira]